MDGIRPRHVILDLVQVLFASRRALVIALAGSAALAACTGTGNATSTPADVARTPIQLAEMISNSDAIVTGTATGEAEVSWIPREPPGGHGTPVAADRYRNFIFEVRNSYVPGVSRSDTIAVRVYDGVQGLRIPIDDVAARQPLSFDTDAEHLLFLNERGGGHPNGLDANTYFDLPRSRIDANGLTTGYLVWQGGSWSHPDTSHSITQSDLEQLVAEYAHVVRPACLDFWSTISYTPSSTYTGSLEKLVEKSDAVIKARLGGELAQRESPYAAEVLDVLSGDVAADQITLGGNGWGYTPEPAPCDFYLFLTEGQVVESSNVYHMTGGLPSVFAVDGGVIEPLYLSPATEQYRGMTEEQFRAEVLDAIAAMRAGDG